ncbi:MAG: dephospho-CoA kinase [Prevotellaceae bacterium]|jgi:dephospho-CoA kinase|nr:dephospho-CoA kinase [Prevotellaceae bacterium]
MVAYAAGLTGGIGSGKTMAGKVFSAMGIPVFNADEETKRLYDTDAALRAQLIRLLGEELYDGNTLRRRLMAARIFADETLLEKVNALVHPAVVECFKAYAAQQQAPYVLMESAILFTAGIHRMMRATVAVVAPEALRLQRVRQRDAMPEEAVRLRMRRQWTDEQWRGAADFIIVNDGKQAVLPQVMTVHEKICALALAG